MPGDKVLFARGNYAEITFFTGEKFHVEPNVGTLMDRLSSPDTPLASVEIGNKDLGWYRWLSTEHFHVFEVSVAGTHTVIEGVEGLAKMGRGGLEHFYMSFMFYEGLTGGQMMFDPLLVSSESIILVGPDNDSVNVSTFQGDAHLYDVIHGTTVDVPAGHMVVVTDDRSTGHNSFGPVTIFSENAVNRSDLDLVNLAEASMTSSTAATQQSSTNGSSPAPGIVATAIAVLAVVFLMRARRGK